MKMKSDIIKWFLTASESIALLFAFIDLYDYSLFFISLSTIFLIIDLEYKLFPKEDIAKTFKEYFQLPLILIAFYILFGTYSKSNVKLLLLLAGYASLRVLHVYLRGELDGFNKMRKMFKKDSKSRVM